MKGVFIATVIGTLVAVFAHADDEGAAAPILARYARDGAQVYLIIATDGAQGGAHTSIPRGPELARVRSEEARCATDALCATFPASGWTTSIRLPAPRRPADRQGSHRQHPSTR